MGLVWLVLRHENQMARLRRVHNDPLLVPHHTARTYFYSIGDRVVRWQDIESHAAYARAAGYTIALALIRQHPAHVRGGAARYRDTFRSSFVGESAESGS